MMFLLLCLFIGASVGVLTPRRYDNDKVFRILPKTEKEVEFIKYLDNKMQLDFFKPASSHQVIPNNPADFHTSAEESEIIMKFLEKKGIKFDILSENLQETIERQFQVVEEKNNRSGRIFRYQPWEKIATWAFSVALRNPKLVSMMEIGKTYEGRPIILLKVGKQKACKKGIILECGIHAREWISPAFCQWFVNEAVKTYGKDKNMTRLLDRVTFHVIPVFNIDGYVWSWTQDRLWRKNRKPNGECIGTDLNRNFNISWNKFEKDEDPCMQAYAGTGPESEVETQAFSTYIRKNLDSIKAHISFHSYGQMLLYPYGHAEENIPNHEIVEKLAVSALEALSGLFGTKYIHGSISKIIGLVSGSSIDWSYEEGIKYSFGFELRDGKIYNFLLPESLIKPTCQETMLAVKVIANHVLKLET
uniref:Carboxypeptidase A3 n=1 Tax=Leptobrachium leishanense TaxID=445787 RepID=A0A8C5MDQ6_9ANUR